MELCCYPTPEKKRFYDIEAIEIPIVYNKYGDHDPNGLMYVLKKDAERVRKCAMQNFSQEVPQPCEEVKPLVIRANKGDTVVVTFTHSLNRPLSIHVQGLPYDIQTSDGASVGYNRDTTTLHRITYTWYANREGVYIFHDMGDPTSSEDSTNIHGLFGAIIVEAPESKWLDPETGRELESGLFADIYHPTHPAFREYAVFFHDELEMKDKDGNQPMDHHTGLPSATTGISYRSEPMRNRHPLSHDPADSGEDISMSSWVHGDPATPVFTAYPNERVIFRTMMPADKPRNVGFTIHDHQWRQQPDDPRSRVIPLQGAVSIGNTFNMELIDGSACPGDYLYRSGSFRWDVESGMWGIFRVLRNGFGHKCKTACRKLFEKICK